MATGMTKNTTIIGIEAENPEGTYVAPSGVNSYIQPLADGFELTPSREKIDRTIITNSIGKATPRLGIKGVQAALPVEMRASGTEGGDVDFGLLLKGALGATRAIATETTTKNAGNTGQILQLEDADVAKFNVGDIVVVKESGAYHCSPISAKDATGGSANITLLIAKGAGNFSNSVKISKATMYYTANTGHPALSLSYYFANTIRQAATGCKVTSMSLDNFTTGQVASLNFQLEGLGYTEADGAAPHTPTYDAGIPPIILGACVYKDTTAISINQLGLSVTNSLGFLTATCNANGRESSRVTERAVTGTINPYKDDTATTYMDAFNAGTEFSLFAYAYNPAASAGEFTLGSVVGIYIPKCIVTEYKAADQEGIMTDEVSFQAVRGSSGNTEELYIGLI